MEKNTDIYYDIEVYYDGDLVYVWRQFSLDELETTIKVTKSLHSKLFFIKNKCKDWNYKVVIK